MCKNKLENKWWENDDFLFLFFIFFMKGKLWVEREKKIIDYRECVKWKPKKKKLWHGDNVSQLERNNNKCRISAFRYI